MEEKVVNKSYLGIDALVLGIISIITALFWYMALPTGIMAIVFGAKSIKNSGSKLGEAGMITGIIGLSLFAFIYISMILILTLANL